MKFLIINIFCFCSLEVLYLCSPNSPERLTRQYIGVVFQFPWNKLFSQLGSPPWNQDNGNDINNADNDNWGNNDNNAKEGNHISKNKGWQLVFSPELWWAACPCSRACTKPKHIFGQISFCFFNNLKMKMKVWKVQMAEQHNWVNIYPLCPH